MREFQTCTHYGFKNLFLFAKRFFEKTRRSLVYIHFCYVNLYSSFLCFPQKVSEFFWISRAESMRFEMHLNSCYMNRNVFAFEALNKSEKFVSSFFAYSITTKS